MAVTVQISFFRGQTVHFAARFYDALGAEVTPPSASLSVVFQVAVGAGSIGPKLDQSTATIAMTSAPLGQPWTADWDSRPPVLAGPVYWSISTGAPIPVAVQDGQFVLQANIANVV